MIATIGINIVANFISPAFDFSNVNPKKISWRMGGMIAAVGSVLLTPWNWYNSDEGILYTLGILGGLIGPLFGVLIAGYYLVSKQKVWVDDMFVMDHDRSLLVPQRLQPERGGRHHHRRAARHRHGARGGRRLRRLREHAARRTAATSAGSSAAGSASSSFWLLEKYNPKITGLDVDPELATDGTPL